MTITIERELQALTPAELAEIAAFEPDAVQAERSRRAAARRRYASRNMGTAGEWVDAAHAQYMQAERELAGKLVRQDSPVRDAWSLWSGSAAFADAHCTDDLRRWWELPGNARVTITQYRAQERHQREAYDDDRLDADAAGRVRPERAGGQGGTGVRGGSAVDPVPPAAAGITPQERAAGRSDGRAGFPVRRGGPMTTTDERWAHKSATGQAVRARMYGTAGEAPAPAAAQWPRDDDGPAPVAPAPARAQVAVREPSAVIAPQRSPRRRVIDGAMVLDYTRLYLSRYVAWPSEAALDLTTAWILHAAARDRDDTGIGPLIWRASPRLLVTSAERGSGKSTVLDLVTILTRSRNGRMPKVTPRAIAQVLGRRHETAILDEAKLILGNGSRSQELQGILLAGYTPRSNYVVSKGGKDDPIPLFGPVAYAGKDELITDTGGMLGDLLDRSVIVRMRQSGRHMPEVDEDAEDDGDLLAGALAAWTSEVKGELRAAARSLADADREAGAVTDGAQLRSAQICRPLRAIGLVAGGGWAERIDDACRSTQDEDMMDALTARFGQPDAAADEDEWDSGRVVSDGGEWA